MTDNLHPVDELLEVRSEIARLKKREDALRDMIVEMAPAERVGREAEASVTQSERYSIDTKAVREEMGEQWVNDRSKVAIVTTVKVRESW